MGKEMTVKFVLILLGINVSAASDSKVKLNK